MKLTQRFAFLIIALVAAVAASTVAGLTALTRLDGALTHVVDNDMERLLAITHARRLFRSMVVSERDYLLADDEAARAKLEAQLQKHARDLAEQLDRYVALMPGEDASRIRDIRLARTHWLEVDARVRARASNREAAAAIARQHTQAPVSWEKVIGELVQRSETRLDAQVAQTHAVYLTARSGLLGVSALAVLVAAGLGGAIFLSIRRNLAELVEFSTHLESLVRARTETLAQRERSLRLVLDSTGDALIEVHSNGTLTGASSAAATRAFGEPHPGVRLSRYLFPHDPDEAALFDANFDQLVEDVLPWELCCSQMLSRLTRDGTTWSFEWKRVLEDGAFTKILVIARDVTEAVKAERAEKSAREEQRLIGKLLQDKAGFAQFVRDSEALLSSLSSGRDLVVAKRDLHTLKGNAAIFEFDSIAEFCHKTEDRIAETGELPSAAEIADLTALWNARMLSMELFLAKLADSRLEVDVGDHERLIDSLLDRKDYEELLAMVETWSWPRTAEHLMRLRAHAEQLAKRLGKHVRVSVVHGDLRLPRDYLEAFWPTLIHVVRNAVDHGSEPVEARLAAGKPAETQIVLTTQRVDDALVIEVSDDGPGVDRKLLLASAQAKGLSVSDASTTEDLVFMDGLSSRTEVSATSGRGVGLAAVRHACQATGGRVALVTEPGRGTTFRFRFRLPVVKPKAIAARLAQRWSLHPEGPANTNAVPAVQVLGVERS